MEIDAASPAAVAQPYTILRIKRRRDEEPLDALGKPAFVESRVRRKKRGGLNVFQFAETVEPQAWGHRSKDLQNRISALEREQNVKVGTPPTRDDAPLPQTRPEPSRQYTVVMEDKPLTRNATAPPAVLSAKELEERRRAEYKLYDAVLASGAPSSPVDPEMDKFQTLLQDYLTIHDGKPSSSTPAASAGSLTPSAPRSSAPVPISAPAPIPPTDDPDYVWDVFYHRAGLLNEYDGVTKIATLTGLPEPLEDSYASSSDSEEEDEADEDSNAEEYYKNDYPDEDSSEYDTSDGSDMFHEDTEDYDDHDWR
ncbi:hypothetical protein BC834DRAFT_1002584 [Gloeopeniophorella convolvens]|nr:hypothetical protein BC834DRAFT_1002584 [Gloeopeniophorella convolvens]